MARRKRTAATANGGAGELLPLDLAVCVIEEWTSAEERESMGTGRVTNLARTRWTHARAKHFADQCLDGRLYPMSRPVSREVFDAWHARGREKFIRNARTPAPGPGPRTHGELRDADGNVLRRDPLF